jgi:hypothetical protein
VDQAPTTNAETQSQQPQNQYSDKRPNHIFSPVLAGSTRILKLLGVVSPCKFETRAIRPIQTDRISAPNLLVIVQEKTHETEHEGSDQRDFSRNER